MSTNPKTNWLKPEWPQCRDPMRREVKAALTIHLGPTPILQAVQECALPRVTAGVTALFTTPDAGVSEAIRRLQDGTVIDG